MQTAQAIFAFAQIKNEVKLPTKKYKTSSRKKLLKSTSSIKKEIFVNGGKYKQSTHVYTYNIKMINLTIFLKCLQCLSSKD